ncbi:luciferase family oxidoreductase group 1 [Halopolyspora algeriensis]|uniref:Luciferase family oxidoreductase group 1 n=1 Tax=Halopolyspora algeriensis TaxID=1500506 RepID=A0A368VWQ4_9ACTN|nr:LLM class flavin-dependent oxidoreductase [Halopolyspora algeriensis]RCW45168.1 luciferase family oxidoreductase group 1 [Halopolyspora algeriensis]TQM53113.1 luciferase family oxidoreductase group 1 [Halopolyspora algeriensis]
MPVNGLYPPMEDTVANPERTELSHVQPPEPEPHPIRGIARGDSPVPLSVLDLAPVGTETTPGHALSTTTELARSAERWGYHRFWVAEHHGMPGIASSSPAVLIAHLASATNTLRLGSGGVMLPNHAPLAVAEQFGTLQSLYPDRIDLGLGRAPGTDQGTARALRRTTGPLSADDFPQQLGELIAFLGNGFPADHPYADVHAIPNGPAPPVWLLGSSGFSAQVAGALGLPFSFAHHFSSANTMPALKLYRDSFQPSSVLDEPYAKIGVQVIAADTDEEALELARPIALSMLRLRMGNPGRMPSPEEAAEYPYTEREQAFIDNWLSDVVYGSAATVRTELDELRDRTGVDELMITANLHDRQAKLRSYELIAQAYRLPGAPVAK